MRKCRTINREHQKKRKYFTRKTKKEEIRLSVKYNIFVKKKRKKNFEPTKHFKSLLSKIKKKYSLEFIKSMNSPNTTTKKYKLRVSIMTEGHKKTHTSYPPNPNKNILIKEIFFWLNFYKTRKKIPEKVFSFNQLFI